MTHKEINELKKLGDRLIDAIKSNPERAISAVQTLEHVTSILSGNIVTCPVFSTAIDQRKGMIGSILGNTEGVNESNHGKSSKLDIMGASFDLSAETLRIAARMNNFEWKSSCAWKEISNRFGQNVSHSQLKQLGMMLANDAHIVPDRDAKRRKTVLIKWMDENWTKLSPFLQNYKFDGENFQI